MAKQGAKFNVSKMTELVGGFGEKQKTLDDLLTLNSQVNDFIKHYNRKETKENLPKNTYLLSQFKHIYTSLENFIKERKETVQSGSLITIDKEIEQRSRLSSMIMNIIGLHEKLDSALERFRKLESNYATFFSNASRLQSEYLGKYADFRSMKERYQVQNLANNVDSKTFEISYITTMLINVLFIKSMEEYQQKMRDWELAEYAKAGSNLEYNPSTSTDFDAIEKHNKMLEHLCLELGVEIEKLDAKINLIKEYKVPKLNGPMITTLGNDYEKKLWKGISESPLLVMQ